MKNKIEVYYKENGFYKTIKWLTKKIVYKIKQKIILHKTLNSKVGNNPKKLKENKNKKMFMFASVPYFDVGGGQRSSQITNVFNDLGYDVIYIYGIPTGESKVHKINFPTVIHKYVKKFKKKTFEKLLNKEDIVFFEMPTKDFLPYLDIAYIKKSKIVYENIDNWESSMGNNFFNKEVLKSFLEKSTLLTATSMPLKEQLLNYLKNYKIKNKEVLYSANAVNEVIFNPNKKYELPSDMKLGKKTFLYYGSLWVECYDWSLIEDLAKHDKDYEINIIGDEKTVMHKVEKMPKNVHFLGLKKQTELPNYLAHTDYTLFPFKNDEVGKYVSPLKIFEYISMNTLVLATCLPDIKGYPNTFNGDTFKEWKRWIESEPKIDKQKAQAFIEKNNWKYRCKEILEKLNEVNYEE